MPSHLLFYHALSPLHAGIGQGAGAIDLPIARDVATGRPLLPGSSCKGVLRDCCRAQHGDGDTTAVFGPDTLNAHEHAGAVQFGDARLLLFPVRSLRGTFAWITCPDILASLAREARLCGLETPVLSPQLPLDGCCVWPQPSREPDSESENDFGGSVDADALSSALDFEENDGHRVYFEELDLPADTADEATRSWALWCSERLFPLQAEDGATPAPRAAELIQAHNADQLWWRDEFCKRFCVVAPDVFNYLVNTATEVRARNVLSDEGKTATNLWYEESLPAESVLWEYLNIARTERTTLDAEAISARLRDLCNTTAQFGGKATVGRGLCQLHLLESPGAAEQVGGEIHATA